MLALATGILGACGGEPSAQISPSSEPAASPSPEPSPSPVGPGGLTLDQEIDDILRDEYSQFVDYHDDFLKIFADYTRRKGERNLVDYDDLLLFWALLLEASPELGQKISGLYDHILVDEYQDTNVLQARILRGMCRSHSNITVVGDDAQSIYSFRGANFRNILDFPKTFADATSSRVINASG